MLFFVVDEDECNNGFVVCGLYMICENILEFYKCLCVSGFDFEEGICYDINECSRKVCYKDVVCYNIEGSFFCFCKKGYEGDGLKKCVDIDECKIVDYKVLCICCIFCNYCFVICWVV